MKYSFFKRLKWPGLRGIPLGLVVFIAQGLGLNKAYAHQLQVLEDSPRQLKLELKLDPIHSGKQFKSLQEFMEACQKCVPSSKAGEPNRPYYPIQVVAEKEPSINYVIDKSQSLFVKVNPKPVPISKSPTEEVYEKDLQLYKKANALTPVISTQKKMRSLPVYTVLLPLASWDESKSKWNWVTDVTWSLRYKSNNPTPVNLNIPKNMEQSLANPIGAKSQIKNLGLNSLRKIGTRQAINIKGPLVKIQIGDREVEGQLEDGYYKLTYQEIRAADKLRGTKNFTFGNSINSISMYAGVERRPSEIPEGLPHGGNLIEVPIRVVDVNKDGTFDDEDYIEFFAHGTSVWNELSWDSLATFPIHYELDVNPFSFYNYYYLDFKSGAGKKLETLESLSVEGSTKTSSYTYLHRQKEFQLGTCAYGHYDTETGKDWYWVANTKECDVSYSGKANLTSNQLNFDKNMFVDYATGSTSYFGFYRVPSTRNNNFVLNLGDNTGSYISPDVNLNGSYYMLDGSITENDFSVVWNDITRGYGFDGYTVIYMREHNFSGEPFYLFPDVFDEKVSWKITGSNFEVLKIEEGIGVGWLNVNGSGVFTDIATKGLSTKYYIYSKGISQEIKAENLFYEKPIPDGALSGLSNTPSGNTEYLIISPDSLINQALELKNYRNNEGNFKTSVVRTEDIYRHFSSGRVSPVAIRDYLRWLYFKGANSTPDSSLKHVLLFGDGHFDYRNIYAEMVDIAEENIEPNFIPPFEVGYNASDDYYTYMDDEESVTKNGSASDFALGRIPVSSDGEAAAYINKIKVFNDPAQFGTWRNKFLSTADDDFQRNAGNCDIDPIREGHTNDARVMNELVLATDPAKITDNVYLLNYEANFANSKPEAAQDLLIKLNKGVIAANYIGHGSDQVWADEGLFVTKKAVPKLSNKGKTGLITSFSCTVGRFEKFTSDGLSETLISLPEVGALSTVSATRESLRGPNIALATGFFRRVFELEPNGGGKTLGDALLEAKSSSNNFENNQKYALFGEPVETLRKKQLNVKLTKSPTSIRAMDCGVMQGTVSGGSGEGYVHVDVFGANSTKLVPGRECDIGDSRPSKDQYLDVNGPLLFSSTVPFSNGKFSLDYVFNDRIPFGDSAAYIKVYAWDKNRPMEGGYFKDSLLVAGEANSCDMESTEGPQIIISGCERSQTSLADFDKKISLPIPYCVEIVATDSTGGVFVTDRPDEGTTVEVWDLNNSEQLAAPVQPRLSEDEFTRKSFKWEFDNSWKPGQYLLKVRAQDGFGNMSTRELEVTLKNEDFLSVYKVFNVPNPIKEDGTCFYFGGIGKQNSGNFGEEDANFNAEIKIFNQSGYLVKQLKNVSARINISAGKEECKIRGAWWDGNDFYGKRLGNGIYYYQVKVKQNFSSSNGIETKSSQRKNTLVISR